MDRIEAVTTCVGYADFLAATLPYNLPLFDRFVIVTAPEDSATRELCRRYSVPCILSREHKRDRSDFNKARLINRGIDQLSGEGWIVHVDADIVLPRMFRTFLGAAHLDESSLYGCDRLMVRNHAAWCRMRDSGYLDHGQHDYHVRVNTPPGVSCGTRWVSELYGYVPIGFFQLWHGSCDLYRGIHIRRYPTEHSDAARTDIQFALQWDRRQRQLLPEIVAVHLESEPAKLGANWRGRKTKPFGPDAVHGKSASAPGHTKQAP